MGGSKLTSKFERIPKFITGLYKVTDSDEYEGIMWTKDGSGIHIYDKETFMKKTMPRITKTKEYGSFIRMLNSYGFLKSKDITEGDVYINRNFIRGKEDLLPLCKFIKNNELAIPVNSGNMKKMIEFLYQQNNELFMELSAYKKKVERQEQTLNGIIEILSRVFKSGSSDTFVKHPMLNGISKNEDMGAIFSNEENESLNFLQMDSMHPYYNLNRINEEQFRTNDFFNEEFHSASLNKKIPKNQSNQEKVFDNKLYSNLPNSVNNVPQPSQDNSFESELYSYSSSKKNEKNKRNSKSPFNEDDIFDANMF